MTIRIGVDTGGTFTDVVLYDTDEGTVRITKTPSTPDAFDVGVLTGIDVVLKGTGIDPERVAFLSHGTTVGTNAVLEDDIPDIGLITNEGLRDVLEIGDQTRPDLYDLQTDKPPAVVPRYLRKEVSGRLDSRGNVVEPLDEERARKVVSELADEDVESIVVSMLFSYLNEAHERRIGELVAEAEVNVDFALTSAVHPEIREYDRTITTVLNEAIKTTVEEYFGKLDDGIADRDIGVPLNVMHSGGGVFSTEEATRNAIRTVLSGPAAGAVAVRDVSEQEGHPNAIGMDMGGTSTDVSIVRDGSIVRSTEGEINDLPIKTPMIDINTVGAGGGSIAWIDEGGALRVGPQSAGADPGPICYGRGGTEPTLTDANLLLGRLNPEAFVDGSMDVATEEARSRFESAIADPLSMSLEEAAQNVVDVANASLAREIRGVTVERGQNPSEFALVAFGGAGPLQAPAVARQMDMSTVVIPQDPGVFSARGLLMADVRVDESHAYRSDGIDVDLLNEQFDTLERRLESRLRDQGFDAQSEIRRAMDIRYKGQSYELTVPIEDGTINKEILADCKSAFHDEHERLYGYANREEAVEILTLRAHGHVETPSITTAVQGGDDRGLLTTREVYFPDIGYIETNIFDRSTLGPGDSVKGPAILEEESSTSLIPRDTIATVSDKGNLLLSL